MVENKNVEIKGGPIEERYVRRRELVEIAKNQKEDYLLVKELFQGNDMAEQDFTAHIIKLTKMIDTL